MIMMLILKHTTSHFDGSRTHGTTTPMSRPILHLENETHPYFCDSTFRFDSFIYFISFPSSHQKIAERHRPILSRYIFCYFSIVPYFGFVYISDIQARAPWAANEFYPKKPDLSDDGMAIYSKISHEI